MHTYEQQAALATVLGVYGLDVSDMDYDQLCSELACIADDVTARPARAEEVTSNCEAIGLDLHRHLRRAALTPAEREQSAREILALHACACEHDGASDAFDRAARYAERFTEFCP